MMENLDLAAIGPLLVCGVVGLFLGFLLGRRGSSPAPSLPAAGGSDVADLKRDIQALTAARQKNSRENALMRAELVRLRKLEAGGSSGNQAELKEEIKALRASRTKHSRDLALMRAEVTRLKRLEAQQS